jgi:hypothetical protein
MLSTSFRWRITDDSAFLDYNAGNVANVQQWRGNLVLVIRWQGHTVGGPVATIRQGVRYAERWIAARPGWPGKRPRRWYDAPKTPLTAERWRELYDPHKARR